MIMMAMAMYSQDYDERFPPGAYAVGTQSVTLPALLHPYIKNERVWQCPMVAKEGDRISTYDGKPDDTTVSYGYNWAGLTRSGIGVRAGQVRQPVETVAFVETTSHLATPPMLIPALGGTAPAYRHDRTLNVAWVDGHVKFEKPGKLEMTAEEEGGKPTGSGIDRYRYWNLR
jgi:prepilin-type processing-associated H-X9-DG protein